MEQFPVMMDLDKGDDLADARAMGRPSIRWMICRSDSRVGEAENERRFLFSGILERLCCVIITARQRANGEAENQLAPGASIADCTGAAAIEVKSHGIFDARCERLAAAFRERRQGPRRGSNFALFY
jgi:hypothetical protein